MPVIKFVCIRCQEPTSIDMGSGGRHPTRCLPCRELVAFSQRREWRCRNPHKNTCRECGEPCRWPNGRCLMCYQKTCERYEWPPLVEEYHGHAAHLEALAESARKGEPLFPPMRRSERNDHEHAWRPGVIRLEGRPRKSLAAS